MSSDGAARRALVGLSAALAGRDPERLREALDRAGEAAPARAVEESLVQSYLFLGYPVALNALAEWRRRSEREADAGEGGSWAAWRERGREVCATVYGNQYDRLRENVRRLHPDLEEWMVVEGYGKVLGRPGLALVERELCIVAILAVLDTPRQLYSHLRGAVNAGASEAEVEEALETALEESEDPAVRERGREVWREVRRRMAERRAASVQEPPGRREGRGVSADEEPSRRTGGA